MTMNTCEEQFRALIENTSVTLAILETNGTIRYESPSVEKSLGFERGERTGTPLVQWLHPDDAREITAIMDESSRNPGTAITRNLRVLHKNGSWRTFAITGENLLLNPSVQGFVIHYNDITERMKLEEQVLQSQKMEAIGKLAGGIAHDFNNLLLAIQGYTEIGLMTLNAADPLHQDLKEVHNAALSAADLTRQLLILSQKQSIKPTIISINKIINGMMKMFMRIIGENITIETELEPELWRVKADKANIEQLLLNLVVNAKDAMPRGGRLTIKTENRNRDEEPRSPLIKNSNDTFICLTITDTGIGMDKETMKNIFDPFYTTKDAGKGTGLGLSIVYGVVARHEGHIEVSSEPDKGSTFSIYLPRTMQDEEEKPKMYNSTLWGLRGDGEKILVVEDDGAARRFLKRVLEKYNYTVKAAASAKEALEVFKEEQQFNLVFSDVVLPDSNGLELVQGLLQLAPDLKVLLTSGYAEEKSQLTMINERQIPFIHKPYPLVVLLQTIRRVMADKTP
jgi:two-component system, cell cycle sensor histidine kinase and response regulator CckA